MRGLHEIIEINKTGNQPRKPAMSKEMEEQWRGRKSSKKSSKAMKLLKEYEILSWEDQEAVRTGIISLSLYGTVET